MRLYLHPKIGLAASVAAGLSLGLAFGLAWRRTRNIVPRSNLKWDSTIFQHEELFSIESLEQKASTLAVEQQVVRQGGSPGRLQAKLKAHERCLLEAYHTLAEDARQQKAVPPAAEWLLDNFPLVLDQLREIRQDLPGGYYRQLPKLANGPLAGFPRVYAMALELINHTDARLDLEHMLRFVQSYQNISPLLMGELWAIAIMLRVGLIESLGRLAETLLEERQLGLEANQWADCLLIDSNPVNRSATILSELVQRYPQVPAPFAAQLLHRLRDYDDEANIETEVQGLERYFDAQFGSTESLIRAEKQRQAINQATAGNTITSMRTLSAINGADWFEQVSVVDQIMRKDPAQTYARSTFATRDHYRHEVERLARGTNRTEVDIAWQLVNLAQAQAASLDMDATKTLSLSHIGYYLIGRGRAKFEAQLNYHPGLRHGMRAMLLQHPNLIYLSAVAGGTTVLVAAGLKLTGSKLGSRTGPLVAGLLLLPSTEIAQGLVSWSIAKLLPPHLLPRLDLSEGIPLELRTMVVIPTLLLTRESVAGQFDRLEVIYLANTDPHLHFALLSDFADASAAQMPEDQALLELALARTAQLNVRYGADRFFLFHRRREWNKSQGCYMGWERKRGKLEEFNRLLAGATDTSFEVQSGELGLLSQMRYVITLDADTQLPRDRAKAMIGTLAHPLNRAIIDPASNRVIEGYGILQPRIGIDLESATRSHFARLFSGNVGLDPYTTAVSNVYMDLFGVGIFAGKGIYDPAVLHQVLNGRFPENTLLSHDLIEGTYSRTGLLSDVELLDNYPTTYASYAARMHRWVRGDWQILHWLLPWVPQAGGSSTRNVLPVMARYKIFDNLRRSLIPPAILAMLGATWTGVVPGSATAWTLIALAPLALPVLFDLLDLALGLVKFHNPLTTLRASGESLRLDLVRFCINLSFLADQGITNLDAIGRTLIRLFITRRNLLEWETAEQVHHRTDNSYGYLFKRLLMVVPPGAILTVLGSRYGRRSWQAALPVLANWLMAPAIAGGLDRSIAKPSEQLSEAERLELHKLARTYWEYFATFVTEEGHYLAPDNFQEDPDPVVAYRTSPTNIGLQLLADFTAHDFGYIGLYELTERTERTFATLHRLEHFQGHLLNWYDTKTLQPLPPSYVSMVDSGNLAGYLLTLRQGYLTRLNQPIIGPEICAGLQNTLALLQAELKVGDSKDEVEELAHLLAEKVPVTVSEYTWLLQEVERRANTLTVSNPEARRWATNLKEQAQSLLRDLGKLLPWALRYPNAPSEAASALDALFGPPPVLGELVRLIDTARETLTAVPANQEPCQLLTEARANLIELDERHRALIEDAIEQVQAMDFQFLYDSKRSLFSIGYFVTEGRRDNSYYDLLASEARLGSFVAIAKGDVPQEHWFHLGRALTPVGNGAALISWSGTMFEYLMPLLVMRNYPESLLDQTYKAAVTRQRQYGRQRKIPWGISESAYNARDLSQNYQYRAFGVPGLGLKRGLGSELVVAPYASVMALAMQPRATLSNIQELIAEGMQGNYGLYEAMDYTAERLLPGKNKAIVRSFMVHHQAMSLLALNNYLNQDVLQRRFHNEPMVQATEMLLQEQFSRQAPRQKLPEIATESRVIYTPGAAVTRRFTTPHTPVPYTHLLSNGKYTVVLTNSGAGFSRYNGLAVTRWHEDSTRDNWGNFCYIRDTGSGVTWASAYQPTCHEPQDYRVVYSLHKAEFRQQVAGIETRLEVTVSPEDNAEVRHLSLINLTSVTRELELTSYAEIVLAPAAADNTHPAFSNLFIETEFLPDKNALIASRRPRTADETRLWGVHVVAVRGHTVGVIQYETDRAAFLGRGGSSAKPAALQKSLSNTTGAVLDPIFSLRRRVRIVPGGTVQLTFTTAVTESREQALQLADKYHDHSVIARAFELAWTDSQVELSQLNISGEEVHRFQRLGAHAIYADSWLRAEPQLLEQNAQGQPGLWKYGISGDYPIILVKLGSGAELSLVRELLLAHEYWRINDLKIDLVILNEEAGGYSQGLQEQLLGLVRSSRSNGWLDRPGGVFVLRGDMMPTADQILLQTVARGVLLGQRGDLAQQLRLKKPKIYAPPVSAPGLTSSEIRATSELPELEEVDLEFANGYGGFSRDGQEYIINLKPGEPTPAPWTNVLANESFGCIVTERGGGYTWSQNSRENRLTPWSNDPVSDPCGEAIYLRDEQSRVVWSPLSQPVSKGYFRIRHGFGYSNFEHIENEIHSSLTLFVPPSDPVKIYRLQLHNRSNKPRQFSATFYVEWVLGVLREQMAPYVITSFDAETGAVLARNPYNSEFGERIAFVAANTPEVRFTCDRREFIGRNRSLAQPLGLLSAEELSGLSGAGLDPCTALRYIFELAPGEQHEVIFMLGQTENLAQAQSLITRYRDPKSVAIAYNATQQRWQTILQKVQVHTPEPMLDILLNGWLLYQTLACRVWARSAFYQSGGAYGFRDQLQDVMALVLAAPELAREQLLRAAQRQFIEGDVQHWWHPPTGRGIRTNFSDDYLWLPFVTSFYVKTAGDVSILDQLIPFLEDRLLNPGEAEYYDVPRISEQQGTLYEHCIRALDHAVERLGVHGLPLMGGGDWNDGMNLVGEAGQGESIWVGFFLYLNLLEIAGIAQSRGEADRAKTYRKQAKSLQAALEEHAWDGEWYLRAIFDDGTPLGSTQNEECRIDSLAQSWAVISGAADPARARQAMEAVEKQLIDREVGLIKLFTPPFDKTSHNPGYIKGYVPGVRENGGQYTHAAIWVIWAYTLLGEGKKTMELFSLINPINHLLSDPERYKVEPYVIAADVYSEPPHTGRGGWTWYTGSASWLYRLGLDRLLGLHREGDYLCFVPCIPSDWQHYEINYTHNRTSYHIQVENQAGGTKGVIKVKLDGMPLVDGRIYLEDDGKLHQVEVGCEAGLPI